MKFIRKIISAMTEWEKLNPIDHQGLQAVIFNNMNEKILSDSLG